MVLLSVLLATQNVPACGPFSLNAVFTFVVHPEFPLEKFANGEVGVIQPTFARSYLVAAYRNINNARFSEGEQKQLVALWNERLDSSSPDFDDSWPKSWLEARQTVPGVAALSGISTSRNREKPNEYETYVNCQKDAFETAAATLKQRIIKFGADSDVIRDWVVAQDAVFANCSEGSRIPAAAPAGADAVIRADRAYQIAAANFYGGNFDAAQQAFAAIGRDSSSPWRQMAPYLSARTYLRKASLGPAESRTESLTKAEEGLQKILNDRSQAANHAAAARPLNLVRLRLRPETRLHELAMKLAHKDDESLKQDLWDYTALLDNYIPDEDSTDTKPMPESALQDDLTDWVVTIQDGSEKAAAHAFDRWRSTSSPAWLIAALMKATPSRSEAGSLIAAADKILPTSPAYPSAMFHALRLTTESGNTAGARAKLDEILTRNRSHLPASSLNLFLSLRFRLANNLSELLKYAQRVPAGFSWDEDGRELPADLSEDSDMKGRIGKSLFDADGAKVLNQKLPLSVLQQAVESNSLPAELQRDLAQATWLRAVILDDQRRATEIAPTVKRLIPAIAPQIDAYLAAQEPDAMKFAGLFTWLKAPGLQPIVTAGTPRRTGLDQQDQFRDNWWCAAALTPGEPTTTTTPSDFVAAPAFTAKTDVSSPAFLTAAEKAAAKTEAARLAALGSGPTYLAKQVVGWVEKHPTDPRNPEALHLAVKTTRYGCTDKESGRWSKAAYDVLHKRYPTNPWTKKTPYWFKD